MTFRMPVAGRTFLPDNAELVSTASDKQGVSNPDYKSELEAWRKDKEINTIMRSRHGVNM